MKKEKSIFRRIISFMIFVASIVILIYVYNIYKTKDFNDFVRAEKSPYTSEFKRDKEVKLGENASYKIESDKFNDAMFYKVLKVEPNTPYKITCMVKTENVENLVNNQGGGAQIAIESSTERTKAITGTNDWQQLVLYFNSSLKPTFTSVLFFELLHPTKLKPKVPAVNNAAILLKNLTFIHFPPFFVRYYILNIFKCKI